jgi:hypothetical protein
MAQSDSVPGVEICNERYGAHVLVSVVEGHQSHFTQYLIRNQDIS